MAEAMIGGLLAGQVCSAESIWATDPVAERRDRLKGSVRHSGWSCQP